jgi:formate hydrogenlyase subunit 6/NADH:ubiquinone oxidoreductase subunit I
MIGEVYRNLMARRATILYPFKEREKVPIPEGLRGKIAFDRSQCVGCSLCARDCPSEAVEMIDDEKGKRPIFHLDRCTFCAQCEEICAKGAIKLTQEFELASFDRNDLVVR